MKKYKDHIPPGSELIYLGLTLKIIKYDDECAIANYVDYSGQIREFVLTQEHLAVIYADKIGKYPNYMNIRSIKNDV
jgi:hypothetical protein